MRMSSIVVRHSVAAGRKTVPHAATECLLAGRETFGRLRGRVRRPCHNAVSLTPPAAEQFWGEGILGRVGGVVMLFAGDDFIPLLHVPLGDFGRGSVGGADLDLDGMDEGSFSDPQRTSFAAFLFGLQIRSLRRA